MNKTFLAFALFLLLGGMTLFNRATRKASHVTVLIHGTKASEIWPLFAPILRKLEGSFFNNHKRGLAKIAPDSQKDYNYFHQTLGPLLAEADNKHYPLKHMYVFGHAGTMDPEKRELIGYNLYHKIKKLHEEYKAKDGVAPKIIIIGHSHGGNIGLNIATGLKDDKPSFTIDRLIMLATPVQKYTKDLVTSPLFEKVYSLHSHRDIIQVVDPQGLHNYEKDKHVDKNFFSERHFKNSPNLIQAHIRWKKAIPLTGIKDKTIAAYFTFLAGMANLTGEQRGLIHVEFLLPAFISRLPEVIKELDEQEKTHGVDSDNPDIVIEL